MKKISVTVAVTVLTLSITVALAPAVFAGEGKIEQRGKVTTLVMPAQKGTPTDTLDYANAHAMPLPQANSNMLTPEMATEEEVLKLGTPGFTKGSSGDGKEFPVRLFPKEQINLNSLEMDGAMDSGLDDVAPMEYGTANTPFTTSRVDLSSNTVSKLYPYRASGKLFFKKPDGNTYVCSASLIKRGLAVTAAHCVAAFGKKQFYNSWSFVPAYYDNLAPYQSWSVSQPWVMTSYFNGTDPCQAGALGVVCKNDIAVLELTPKSGAYPGTNTGWYNYGWNGYGFTGGGLAVGAVALINQLGYPVSHDGGNRMQRTDSQGYISNSTSVNNTIWGGRQTGGSSGGPELVNLGIGAVLSGGVGLGSEAAFNTVIGVTSWGYTNQAIKRQGASPFLSTNISVLISSACASSDPRCL